MKDIDILPLIVDLIGSFFRSSRDALGRAKSAACTGTAHEPTGLNIFSHRHAETQAALETIVFSFLTVEATINYVFFDQLRSHSAPTGLDKWLKQKWKHGLSIADKYILLFTQYATTDLDKFQNVTFLFSEFIKFRNRIVHSHPEVYNALVESSEITNEVLLHDVEPLTTTKNFAHSGLSEEIVRIGYEDAARCYEIMLLILALVDEQFIAELELPWYEIPGQMETRRSARPKEIAQSLEPRYYPKIDPNSFVPEIVERLKDAQPGAAADVDKPRR